MNQFTAAGLQSGSLRYKHLTVGDMRPDATTKLYKRMFKGPRRRYIPVKDITNDQMGRELNAYLINPEYMDRSVVSPEVVSQRLEPKPVVRTLQYSKLSYDRRTAVEPKSQTISRTAALFGAALKLGKRAVQVVQKTTQKITGTSFHSPFGRTYALGRGMGMHRRRKIFASAGAFAAIATFGIVGISTIGDHTGTQGPKPISAPTSSIEGPATHSGTTTQPIPLFAPPVTTPITDTTSVSYASTNASTSATKESSQASAQSTIATNQTSVTPETTPGQTANTSNTGASTGEAAQIPATNTAPPENVLSSTVETVTDVTTQTLDGVSLV